MLLVSRLLLPIIGLWLLWRQLAARVLVRLPRCIIVRGTNLRCVAVVLATAVIRSLLLQLLGWVPLLMHRRAVIVAHLVTLGVLLTAALVGWKASIVATSAVAIVEYHVR